MHVPKRQVDNETVFEAASISKTVFAYVVMKLCEKGIMNLDTPLSHYLPSPILADDERSNLITARLVLSHQGGLQNFRGLDDPLKIHFTPGTDFMYSGEGYYYLQSAVTQLVGKVNPNDCGSYEADLKMSRCRTTLKVKLCQSTRLQPLTWLVMHRREG